MLARIWLAIQRALFSLLLQSTPTVRGTRVSRDKAGEVPIAWVEPPEHRANEVLFYLHGGGYCWGSIRSHLSFVTQLAAAVGCRAVVVEYRRAPEHPFPAALDDALSAYRWLCARETGSRIAIAGESAGAGLALSVMQALDQGDTRPVAGLLLSPWVDLSGQMTRARSAAGEGLTLMERQLLKTAEQYADGVPLNDPRISPMYGNHSGLPPLLIHSGTREFLARDAAVLSEKAREQGVEVSFEQYEGGVHVLHTFVHLSKRAREYLRKAAHFLEVQLRPGGGPGADQGSPGASA